jgi:hypothetical protein
MAAARRRDDERIGRRVVAIRAELGAKALAQAGLHLGGERIERLAEVVRAPCAEQGLGLHVEPLRRPVRSLVGAVAPDGPDLLAADALPDLLTVEDLGLGHQEPSVLGLHASRQRRRLAVDLSSEEAEHEKGAQQHRAEREP